MTETWFNMLDWTKGDDALRGASTLDISSPFIDLNQTWWEPNDRGSDLIWPLSIPPSAEDSDALIQAVSPTSLQFAQLKHVVHNLYPLGSHGQEDTSNSSGNGSNLNVISSSFTSDFAMPLSTIDRAVVPMHLAVDTVSQSEVSWDHSSQNLDSMNLSNDIDIDLLVSQTLFEIPESSFSTIDLSLTSPPASETQSAQSNPNISTTNLMVSTSPIQRRPSQIKFASKHKVRKQKKKVDEMGNMWIVLGNNQASRQPYSKEQKKRTNRTRALGACDRCRHFKRRCDRPDSLYECCGPCKLRVLEMPCFLAKLTDIALFRDKPSPAHPRFSLRHNIFESLSDIDSHPQTYKLKLTQNFGEELEITVAGYLPRPGEKTYRTWKDKSHQWRKHDMPAFCISNMQEASQSMLDYIHRFRHAFLRSISMRSNEITSDIFDQAHRFAAFAPESTVAKALDLCAASRIIERDWRISGDETLGISCINDPDSPWHDAIPITPMMDAQLDQIVIKGFLAPLREKLLQELQARIEVCRREEWYEIFLSISILLSHAEWLLEHSRKNAVRCGAKTRYNYMPRAESYFHACKTLLAFFHHACRGSMPLILSSKALQHFTFLDGEQRSFIQNLSTKIITKEKHMLRLRKRSEYETELYWTHQAFFPDWKP